MTNTKIVVLFCTVSLLYIGWYFDIPINQLQALCDNVCRFSQQKGGPQAETSKCESLKTVKEKHEEPLRAGRTVTPIIHQSWKSRRLPTKRAERWSASWRTCFPHWEWRLWTDEDNLALVRDHYPWFLPVYLSFSKPVERADLARYFYMFHFGGVYTDLDNVCVKNFEHLLNSTGLLFGGMDGLNDGDPLLHTYVQNSFMASRPGHPFWMRLISRVMLRRNQDNAPGRPEFLTGPYVLMEELREYMRGKPNDTKIYSGKYFNPFTWNYKEAGRCRTRGDMTDAEEANCIASFPDAYVVQLHTQTWLHGHM